MVRVAIAVSNYQLGKFTVDFGVNLGTKNNIVMYKMRGILGTFLPLEVHT